MEGLKSTLICTHQVNIDIGYDDEDIWNIEKGEEIDCIVCDDGIKLKVNDCCWYTLKPSILRNYFKII